MLFVLSLNFLTSCATPPDTPVCVEITLSKGWCTNTISNKEYYVDDEHPFVDDKGKKWTWWELRPAMIRVPRQSWEKIKEFVIKMCKKSNECSEITNWERTVNAIDSKMPTP
jgi:hypothetical protein